MKIFWDAERSESLIRLWKATGPCYNQAVPRKKSTHNIQSPFSPLFLSSLWGALACGLWALEQYLHVRQGLAFQWDIFGKGLLLLAEAALIYHFSPFKGFWFLGMFPLSWLAVSKVQWDLCSMGQNRFWFWLVLFLAGTLLTLLVQEGKKLLVGMVLIWIGLIRLFKFSFLIPFSFVTASSKRFPNSQWIRWGGCAAGTALFFFYEGRYFFNFEWLNMNDLLMTEGFVVFLLLGWLGLVAYEAKKTGTYRNAMLSFFAVFAGFLFWTGNTDITFFQFEILKWILVFMAGFGFEAFRKYIMDPSWHGRLVWLALGAAMFGGVL